MLEPQVIAEWEQHRPWKKEVFVEQDLLLEVALHELYGDQRLKEQFVLIGGTCIQKLHLPKPARYSEDLDLVYIGEPGGVDDMLSALRTRLLTHGFSHIDQVSSSEHQYPKLLLFFTDVDGQRGKMKIEANLRFGDHLFHEATLQPLTTESSLLHATTGIRVASVNELLGMKTLAAAGRRRLRDVFDIRTLCEDLGADKAVGIEVAHAISEPGWNPKRGHRTAQRNMAKDGAWDDVDDLLPAGQHLSDANKQEIEATALSVLRLAQQPPI